MVKVYCALEHPPDVISPSAGETTLSSVVFFTKYFIEIGTFFRLFASAYTGEHKRG